MEGERVDADNSADRKRECLCARFNGVLRLRLPAAPEEYGTPL